MYNTTISQLRLVGFLEGISFIVLLGIAMPLKYFADMPKAVSYVGMAHGFLFIAYLVWVFYAHRQYKWGIMNTFWAVVASLLPFGPFVADARIFSKY